MKTLHNFLVTNHVQQGKANFEVYHCYLDSFNEEKVYIKVTSMKDFKELCALSTYKESSIGLISRLKQDKYIITAQTPIYVRPGNTSMLWEYPEDISDEECIGEITIDDFTKDYWKTKGWNNMNS